MNTGIPSEFQTVLLCLIWVQTVREGYQQIARCQKAMGTFIRITVHLQSSDMSIFNLKVIKLSTIFY